MTTKRENIEMQLTIQLTNLAKHVLVRKRELGDLGKRQLPHDLDRARRGRSAWFSSLVAGTPLTTCDLADAVEALRESDAT